MAKRRARYILRPYPLAGLILLALGAVALTGCGGDDSTGKTAAPASQGAGANTTAAASKAAGTPGATSAPAAPVVTTGEGNAQACALLTKADVEAALGESVGDPQAVSVGSQQMGPGLTVNVSTCSYDSATTAHSVTLSALLADGSSAGALQQTIKLMCQGNESVSGLGDVACWYSSKHGELRMAKGSAFLDFEAHTGGDASDTLKGLAQKAVKRLP